MILINKGPEPKVLVNFRNNTPGASYKSLCKDQKDEIKKALYNEQNGLCAYCMCKLSLEQTTSSTIEHYVPQTVDHSLTLSYQNMLLVCPGKIGKYETCDKKKGNDCLSIDPLNATHMDTIYYDSSAKILSSETKFQTDLDSVLNLNITDLKSLRRSAVEEIDQIVYNSLENGEIVDFDKMYNSFANNKGLPFYGYVIWYIKNMKEKIGSR